VNRSTRTQCQEASLDDSESLAHAKWTCKAHAVWIPKYRRKALYGELRKHLGPVLRELARQREGVVEKGHLNLDHVHMLLSILPKYAVAQILGFSKGKSAIHIARTDPRVEAELHGAALVGPRVLRVYRRAWRGHDPTVHPEARGGGPTPRSTQDLCAVTPPSGGGRFANRFERFTSFKPPPLVVVLTGAKGSPMGASAPAGGLQASVSLRIRRPRGARTLSAITGTEPVGLGSPQRRRQPCR
jgi:REP element-mobilizing transposase RayT